MPSCENSEIEIRIFTYLGNDLSLERIELYWLDILNLPASCRKPSKVQQPISSRQRGRKLPYGTCELRLKNGTKYVQHILGAIQEYAGVAKLEWLDVKDETNA